MELNIAHILTVLGVIFASMTLHELMHGLVAYYLGDETAKNEGRLTLNPLHHIDPFMTVLLPLMLAIVGAPIFGGAKPVPINPHVLKGGNWGMALVGIAGPLTNFIIAFAAFGVLALVGAQSPLTSFLVTAVMVNLGFFVFNMLPIPPLDGSRVLYALAPEFVQKGMEYIERYGVMLVFAIVLFASASLGQFMGVAIRAIVNLFANIFGVQV